MLLEEAGAMGLPDVTRSVAQILVLRPSTAEIVKVAHVDPNCPDCQAQVDFPLPHADRSYVLESSVCEIDEPTATQRMLSEQNSTYVVEESEPSAYVSDAPVSQSTSLPLIMGHDSRYSQEILPRQKVSVATLDNTQNELEDQIIVEKAVSKEIMREETENFDKSGSEYSSEMQAYDMTDTVDMGDTIDSGDTADSLDKTGSTVRSCSSQQRPISTTSSSKLTASVSRGSTKPSRHSIMRIASATRKPSSADMTPSPTSCRSTDKAVSTGHVKSDHKGVLAQPSVEERGTSARRIKSINKYTGPTKSSKSIRFADSMIECEIGERSEFCTLDFNLLRRELKRAPIEKKLLIIQALRWRITSSKPETRNNIMTSYTRHDLLGLHEMPTSSSSNRRSLMEEFFCPKDAETPSPLQEGMARLVNTIASVSLGRDYLCHEEAFIADLLIPLLMGTLKCKIDTTTRDFILVALQKLSLRNKMRKIMISKGMVEFLIDFLNATHGEISEYCLEYTTALLMNLCLHKEARELAKKKAKDVVKLMTQFLEYEHDSSLPYMNGAMYSLLSESDIKKEAKKDNLQKKIEKLISCTEDEIKQQLEIILNILTTDKQSPPCIDCDCIDQEEEVDHLETELNDLDTITGEPNGEKLLEEFKQGEPKSQTMNYLSCLCRPVTPLRKIAANETCLGGEPKVQSKSICSLNTELLKQSLQAIEDIKKLQEKECLEVCKHKPVMGYCAPCKRKSPHKHREKDKGHKEKEHHRKDKDSKKDKESKKEKGSKKDKDKEHRKEKRKKRGSSKHSSPDGEKDVHEVKSSSTDMSSTHSVNSKPSVVNNSSQHVVEQADKDCACDDPTQVSATKASTTRVSRMHDAGSHAAAAHAGRGKSPRTCGAGGNVPGAKVVSVREPVKAKVNECRSKSEERGPNEATIAFHNKIAKNANFCTTPTRLPPPSFTRANINTQPQNSYRCDAAPYMSSRLGCYNYPICYKNNLPPCAPQKSFTCPPKSRYSCECYTEMKSCLKDNNNKSNYYRCQCGRQNDYGLGYHEMNYTETYRSKLGILSPLCYELSENTSESITCECYDNVFQSRPKVLRTP